MEDEISKINNLEQKIIEIEKRLSKIEANPTTAEAQSGGIKNLSINEFVLDKKPKDDNQKTLVIGCFLERYEKIVSFNTKDLIGAFARIKEKTPTNINDKVNQNISKGYMTQLKEKKDKLTAWTLTNKGVELVNQLPEK